MDSKTEFREDTIPLFLSFCIEQFAHQQGLDGESAMRVLLDAGALEFLQTNYEAIHTQSPQWILEEINQFLSKHQN